MIISIVIAEKLLQLANGKEVSASSLKQAIFKELLDEDIIKVRLFGRIKRTCYIPDRSAFDAWMYNKYAISDLRDYINALKKDEGTRAELIAVSNNSKATARRTFKGFLVNSYMPILCFLNGSPLTVHPQSGSFQFIYDFEQFVIPEEVIVVGVENAENFSHIASQEYLFGGLHTLFVSRYPQSQSKDALAWLQSIPNTYLHFGDVDFAGINIYLQEYKRHLGDRASFFIPENTAVLLEKYGNRSLYDKQKLANNDVVEEALRQLISLIHKHKKGLEQEAFLIR